jgi:hypothetical protein
MASYGFYSPQDHSGVDGFTRVAQDAETGHWLWILDKNPTLEGVRAVVMGVLLPTLGTVTVVEVETLGAPLGSEDPRIRTRDVERYRCHWTRVAAMDDSGRWAADPDFERRLQVLEARP